MATDGWVSTKSGGRPGQVGFASKDRDLVESFLKCFGLTTCIRKRSRDGHVGFETSTGKVTIFKWARAVGIHPRKSRTISALDVPGEFFLDLVRGLLDGDGSIIWARRGARGHQFQVRFHSASEAHLIWLRSELHGIISSSGSLTHRVSADGYGSKDGKPSNPMYTLAYGRRASERLLNLLYHDPESPRLHRKWRTWEAYRSREQ